MNLTHDTNKLKEIINERHEIFMNEEAPIDRRDHDFFQQVKATSAPLFELNNQWKEKADKFVRQRKVKVHPRQIESTHENVEMIILHSFYKDVEVKRFKELYRSVHYVLDMVLNDLRSLDLS